MTELQSTDNNSPKSDLSRRSKTRSNPFYVLLVLLGIAFTVTACAYSVMAFRATKLNRETAQQPNGLMTLMEQRGGTILAIEVVLLGLATVGAIGLDQYRQRG